MPKSKSKDKSKSKSSIPKNDIVTVISHNDSDEEVVYCSDSDDCSDEDNCVKTSQEIIHDELLRLRREHYNNNAEHILALQKLSRYKCVCGSNVKSKDKSIHCKSQKHRLYCFENKIF